MKVVINQEECIGCGSCQAMNDKLFKLNEDLKSEYIGGDLAKLEEVMEAARVCPVMAISIFDDEGKRIYPNE